MKLPDFLTEWAEGEIMIQGHRISLFHVIDYYQKGMGLEHLHEWYPTLEPELIQKVLDFYHANRDEVDAYVARERDYFARQEARFPRLSQEEIRSQAEARKPDAPARGEHFPNCQVHPSLARRASFD